MGVSGVVEVLSDAGAVRAVHANCVDFVEEGDGTVFVGEVADFGDGADGAAHAVDGFEGNDFRAGGGQGSEFGFEVGKVVVLEDHFFGAAVSDALDHGGVVHAVGEDDAIGELAAERGERGVISDVAGGEDEGGFLGVEACNGGFESYGVLVMAADITGAASAGAVGVKRFVHRLEDFRIAAHA